MRRPFASARTATARQWSRARIVGLVASVLALLLAAPVGAVVCGDADGNGTVSVTDGVLVLRAAAGLAGDCALAACDVDGNGSVTVTDGVNVLRIAAQLPVDGNCGVGSVANVQPISVDAGPTGDYVNGVFTSVTVCLPNDRAACQTIPHVLVDTGSTGLRIIASQLTLALPQATVGGAPLGECLPFLDGVTWGPVRSADVQIAGERATAIPMQVVGDPAFAPIPSDCATNGMPPLQTVQALGANGILGLAVFELDCGEGCAANDPANPGIYYACGGGGCTTTAVPLASQIPNPVARFASDDSGVVLTLPAVPAAGAPSVEGSLTFGIGTQANNALTGVTVLPTAPDGTFLTLFQGRAFEFSFIDSGSNAIYFLDPAATGIPDCPDAASFYCPANTVALTATNASPAEEVSLDTHFEVANTEGLLGGNPDSVAFGNLAGPSPDGFDFGLSFFFGRRVFVAIEGKSTPGGTGPFVAY